MGTWTRKTRWGVQVPEETAAVSTQYLLSLKEKRSCWNYCLWESWTIYRVGFPLIPSSLCLLETSLKPQKNEDIKTGQIEVMKVGEESLSKQCKMQFKLWVVWLTAHFQVSIAEKLDMVTLTCNLASQNLCPPSPHYCCLSHSAPREILTRTQ